MDSAGVDYGVRRIAFSHPSHMIFDELILTSKDDVKNLVILSDWLTETMWATCPELTVIEQAIQGASRNIRTGISMGMVAGALAVAAQRVHSEVVFIGPSSWKKAVIGNGHSDKEAIAKWLSSKHPHYYEACQQLTKPQDAIDATCMALYGQTRLA